MEHLAKTPGFYCLKTHDVRLSANGTKCCDRVVQHACIHVNFLFHVDLKEIKQNYLKLKLRIIFRLTFPGM